MAFERQGRIQGCAGHENILKSMSWSADERGEALVGRSFVKFFDGKPYDGEVMFMIHFT